MFFSRVDKKDKRDAQSEERKSFKPPFFLPGLSSRMSILLRRCTTQFLGLEGVLGAGEPDPEVLEELEDLEREGERWERESREEVN